MHARAAQVRRTLWIILGLNLLVAAVKAVYGAWSGSVAVSSDAIHSLVDGTSNVVALVAIAIASRPPDENHPYGYRKIESVATALIGMSILLGAGRFAWVAVQRLLAPGEPPVVTTEGLIALIATLAVNVFVVSYETARGRALASALLVADARHTASDVVVTVAVIASQFAVKAGVEWADPVAAIVVVVLIIKVAWSIFATSFGALMDRSKLDAAAVTDVVSRVRGVIACHRVRSAGVGDAIRLDLHMTVDGALTLAAAHRISHEVEDALRDQFPSVIDVTIHVEPDGDPEESL